MRRASTTIVLGGWIGFLATLSAILFCAVLVVAEPGAEPLPWFAAEVIRDAGTLRAWGNGGVLAAAAASFIGVALAIVLGTAIWMLRGEEAGDKAPGERMAACGLVAAAGMVLLLRHVGLFEFDSLPGLLAVVALSLAAIAFDRLIEIEEEDDEDDFQAAIRLGQAMAGNVVRLPAAGDTPPRDRTV